MGPVPAPDWTIPIDEWQWVWQLYTNVFASIFLCLSAYIIFWFLTGCLNAQGLRGNKKTPRLNATLHGLMLTSCLARSIFLFVDPYGSRKVLPCPIVPILWSLGWPCIIVSISVLLLVLLETTRMTLAPPRFQRASVLAAITIPSLAFVLFTDFLVAYDNSANVVLLLCQVLFICWGVLLGTGFLIVAWKLRSLLSNCQGIHTNKVNKKLERQSNAMGR